MKAKIDEFDDNGKILKKFLVDFYFLVGEKGELYISLPNRTPTRHRQLTISLKKLIKQMNKQFRDTKLEAQTFEEQIADAL